MPGSYINVPWNDHERFMQVMVTAVLDLTYRLLPACSSAAGGRIINIASVAGMVSAPAGATLYGASKHSYPVLRSARRRKRAEGRERDGRVPGIYRGGISRRYRDPRQDEQYAGLL